MSDDSTTTSGDGVAPHRFTLSSYDPIEVKLPKVGVEDAHISEQLFQIAKNYATFEKIDDREVRPDDHLFIAVESTENGQPFPGLTTTGRVFKLGEGHMPPGFESEVASMRVGETKTFTFEGPSFEVDAEGNPIMSEVTSTVTVLEIRQEAIPAITDAWVAANIPGANTVPEFREMVKAQMEAQLAGQFEQYKQFACASTLAQRLQERIPDDLFQNGMMRANMQLEMALRQQNMTKADFLKQQGIDEQQFGMQMLMQAREMIAQEAALDAMAENLGIEVNDAEVDAVFGGRTPEQTAAARKACEEAGQLDDAKAAARRMKTLQWVIDNAKIEYQEQQQ